MTNIDLHMHSSHSDDGQYTVLELIKLAEASGLEVASITDHDNIAAAREIAQYQAFTPIKWLKGVELSVRHDALDLHLLAYGFDVEHPWFDQHLSRIRQSEEAATDLRIQKINAHFGLDLTREALEAKAHGHLVTGELVAEVILENPENQKNPLLKPYFPKGSRSNAPLVNFYWDTMAQGKFAYVPTDLSSFYDAVNEIHKAGGLAILAHPGQTIKENAKVLNEMVHLGLDGIECYSSYHSDLQNGFYVNYALKRNLMITCGSDFHGKTKPSIHLGQTNSPLEAKEVLKQLEKRGLYL